jgi:hypothetical protein
VNQPSAPSPSDEDARRQLAALRQSLLALHKTLIASERMSYEQTFGTVESPNKFLQLLISDPWFAWLHPLSELVVLMDEAIETKDGSPVDTLKRFTAQARTLLKTSETGDGFGRSYFEALQREPDVVLAHADVTRHLKTA